MKSIFSSQDFITLEGMNFGSFCYNESSNFNAYICYHTHATQYMSPPTFMHTLYSICVLTTQIYTLHHNIRPSQAEIKYTDICVTPYHIYHHMHTYTFILNIHMYTHTIPHTYMCYIYTHKTQDFIMHILHRAYYTYFILHTKHTNAHIHNNLATSYLPNLFTTLTLFFVVV